MDIQFCDCGSIMEYTEGRLKCRKCGKEKEIKKGAKAKITAHAPKKELIVLESDKSDLPTTAKACPKCGNARAYWWLIQTRSSDEPPTQFFKCTNIKCKHTWREYK